MAINTPAFYHRIFTIRNTKLIAIAIITFSLWHFVFNQFGKEKCGKYSETSQIFRWLRASVLFWYLPMVFYGKCNLRLHHNRVSGALLYQCAFRFCLSPWFLHTNIASSSSKGIIDLFQKLFTDYVLFRWFYLKNIPMV